MKHKKIDHPADTTRTKFRWGCLIALLAVSASYVAISKAVSPSDWVNVTVGPLPKGYERFCLIAQDATGIGTLPWYHSKIFPFTEDPFMNGSLSQSFWDMDHDGFISVSVQWRDARRYGVLVHRPDDQWRLWWIDTKDLQRPSIMRFVFSGGKAEMHLHSEDRAQVSSKELLQQLGYSSEKAKANAY